MPTAYDEVLYAGFPFGQTHPDRLASLGVLFGMEPAAPGRCRVLELGCANGGNLIPMAFELPESQFIGIDLSAVAIRQGREEIAALGLTNIRLEHLDLMDAGDELGTFDYVISHGVYSWVPEPVRDKLLAVAKARLAPQGIAYVSYNALPGCRLREMYREMMLFHVAGLSEPQARIKAARELMEAVAVVQDAGGLAGSALNTVAQYLVDRDPKVLFHDELGEIYAPSFFHEFVAHAARRGLRFLAEANYVDMHPGKLPESVVAHAERFSGGDRVLRDQYFDFFKNRTFRQTLLCHDSVVVPDKPVPGRMRRLYAASPADPVSKKPDLGPGKAEEFKGSLGAAVTTEHVLVKAALWLLCQAWPEALSFDELRQEAETLTGGPADPDGLESLLMTTYGIGLVELHARRPPCVSKVSRLPKASALARWQAANGRMVTTARHTTIDATGEIERRLVALLDGTRDLHALTQDMLPVLKHPEDVATGEVEANLVKLAEFGLLIA